MSRPELLLFDLGGVLIDNIAFERLSAIPGIELDPAEIKSKWLASSTVRSFELGAISAETFAQAFVEEWNLPVEPELFLADFAGWPKGFYPGVPELIHSLRQQFRVACLSNSNAVHWRWFGSLGGHFDIALSSHLLGEIKPDSLCFERALQECRANRESVAFFDDSLENVLAARSLGLQSFHVCGIAQVNHVLLQSGWLQ